MTTMFTLNEKYTMLTLLYKLLMNENVLKKSKPLDLRLSYV